MNSIVGKLTPGSIVATLRMLRSARREVFLVVEGDDDISLFSQAFDLPRSSFVSCFGKERLMEVFRLAPTKGLDSGTVFLRDADYDCPSNLRQSDVVLFATDDYDIEMSLLRGRLFARIIAEFLKRKATKAFVQSSLDLLLSAASIVGVARRAAYDKNIPVKFAEMDFRFIDPKDMSCDIEELVRYLIARSRLPAADASTLKEGIEFLIEDGDITRFASGKDLIRILSLALSRHYRVCNSSECHELTIARMLRIAVVLDDLKNMRFFQSFREHVMATPFVWRGVALA